MYFLLTDMFSLLADGSFPELQCFFVVLLPWQTVIPLLETVILTREGRRVCTAFTVVIPILCRLT